MTIAPPVMRLAGRSAHDAMIKRARDAVTITCRAASPIAACDTAAPVMLKKVPAYAHSLGRGSRG